MYLTKISLKVFAIQIHTLTFTLAYLDLNEIVCSLENTSLLCCLYIKVGFKILHSVLIVWKTTFPTNMTIFSSFAIILHEDVNYLHCQQLANVLLPHAGRGELFTGDLSILSHVGCYKNRFTMPYAIPYFYPFRQIQSLTNFLLLVILDSAFLSIHTCPEQLLIECIDENNEFKFKY